MEENFIPDYSTYETDFLVDVYTRIDRENNPAKAQALDNEIKRRFSLPDDIEINPKLIMSFLTAFRDKDKKTKITLNKNEQMIKHGWIAGVVLGSISFLTWFINRLTGNAPVQGQDLNVYMIVDILGIFALSYGIYRKSRLCAIALGSYFVIIKLFQMASTTFPQNIIVIISLFIFTPLFIRALTGTVRYHNHLLAVGNKPE